jgi:hypothetical protein
VSPHVSFVTFQLIDSKGMSPLSPEIFEETCRAEERGTSLHMAKMFLAQKGNRVKENFGVGTSRFAEGEVLRHAESRKVAREKFRERT